MSEPDNPTGSESGADEPAPAPEHDAGWFVYDEKPVQIQLRQPYIGVSYSRSVEGVYSPSMTKDGGVRASPILTGVVFVKPSGTPSGLLLILKSPIEGSSDFALITIHPDDVLNCTHIHQSRIVPA